MNAVDEWAAARKGAEDKADRLGLTFYVHAGRLHVMDGGKRGYRDAGWESGWSASNREATDEEQEMWELLP